MSQLTNWFQKAVTTLLDPDREARVTRLVDAIQHAMHARGQSFTLGPLVVAIQPDAADLKEAKIRIYRSALEKGWADGTLTAGEQRVAQWLVSRLEIPPEEARELNYAQARRWFGVALAQAMQDGILDANEMAKLQAIAAAVGSSVGNFARAFFRLEGEAFLRSIFLACAADGRITDSEWQYLIQVTQTLGIQHEEMLSAIQTQALQFVEHVLADAKSDGRVSAQEQQSLEWLLSNLRLPFDFCNYVRNEVYGIQVLANIEDGRLPTVQLPAGMESRSGEITHWVGAAIWRETKSRRNGPQAVDHQGVLAITDNRVIFSSPLKSHTLGFRKIVSHRGSMGWAQVTLEGKPMNEYWLAQMSPTFYPILRVAIALANQTIVAKVDGNPTRHIPREVRQRVWQKYGGRCAECNANDYLEFDHIIPHARGGSNAEGNVQLLCRRCNQKKSDNI